MKLSEQCHALFVRVWCDLDFSKEAKMESLRITQGIAQLEAELIALEDAKYCYEDELPCDITSELFAASVVNGVRLYPWQAVAKALKAENERYKDALYSIAGINVGPSHMKRAWKEMVLAAKHRAKKALGGE